MARRRARSRSTRRGRGRKAFPWLLAGAAAVGVFYLYEKSAHAAPEPGPEPGPAPPLPGPTPAPAPVPPPAPGITPGRYQVTTQQTGTAGMLAMRSSAKVDPTNANLIEWLNHGDYVQASGQISNGFAAVMATDAEQKTGWAALPYLTYAP